MQVRNLALAVCACASIASAQGTDSCTTPTVIAGLGPFAFNNAAATQGTQGQTESLCLQFGFMNVDHDVWFTWSAPSTGTARVTTCSSTSVDTKLGAYPGNTCPSSGTALGCNDDGCQTFQLQSTTNAFAVTMGLDYVIQVGTYPSAPGGSGTFAISLVSPPPANDDCASSLVLPGPGTYPYDNTNGTTGSQGQTQAACNFFGTTAIQRDLWYTFTARVNGTITVTTCGLLVGGPSQDSKIALYAGAGCPAGAAIGCNDDSDTGPNATPCASGSLLSSNISTAVVCGATYTFQIGMYGNTTDAAVGQFAVTETGPYCPTPFTVLCAGDGTDASCPCSLLGLGGRGCENTVASGGAALASSGFAGVATPTLVLDSTFAVPFGPGLYYEGNATANPAAPFGIPFGNGLRCAGGTTNRLQIRFADGAGAASTNGNLQALGAAAAGVTYIYQVWYRDTGDVGSCTPGAGFNFSNAISLTWTY